MHSIILNWLCSRSLRIIIPLDCHVNTRPLYGCLSCEPAVCLCVCVSYPSRYVPVGLCVTDSNRLFHSLDANHWIWNSNLAKERSVGCVFLFHYNHHHHRRRLRYLVRTPLLRRYQFTSRSKRLTVGVQKCTCVFKMQTNAQCHSCMFTFPLLLSSSLFFLFSLVRCHMWCFNCNYDESDDSRFSYFLVILFSCLFCFTAFACADSFSDGNFQLVMRLLERIVFYAVFILLLPYFYFVFFSFSRFLLFHHTAALLLILLRFCCQCSRR